MGGSERLGRLVSACDAEACLDEDRVSSLRLLGLQSRQQNVEEPRRYDFALLRRGFAEEWESLFELLDYLER